MRILSTLTALFISWYGIGQACGQMIGNAPLTLERTVELALLGNPDYLSLMNSVHLAELDLEQARSVFRTRIYTSLDSDARTGTEIGSIYRVGVSKLSASGSRWNVGFHNSTFGDRSLSEVRLSYSLPFLKDKPSTNRFTLAQADLEHRHRERVRLIGAEELIAQVVAAYYQLSLTLNSTAIARQEVALAAKLHRATELRSRTGHSSPLDIKRSELQLLQARQSSDMAHTDRMRAETRLKLLLGVDLGVDLQIDDTIPAVSALDWTRKDIEAVEAAAVRNRGELISLAEDLGLARRKLRAHVGKRRPNLDVTLQYAMVGEGPAFSDSLLLDDQRFGIGFSVDLDFGRSASSEKHRLLLFYQNKQHAYDKLASQIKADARTAFLNVRDQASRMRLARQALQIAEKQFEFMELRYRDGSTSTQDVLEAQQALAEAQHRELQARVNYLIATYQLNKASGSLMAQWKPQIDSTGLLPSY